MTQLPRGSLRALPQQNELRARGLRPGHSHPADVHLLLVGVERIFRARVLDSESVANALFAHLRAAKLIEQFLRQPSTTAAATG
jgi:hypothetical protein